MIRNIPLGKIHPNPFQARLSEDPENIRKLADSIAKNTLAQPPAGRADPDDPYGVQLAFGHERFAAYRLLSKTAIDQAGDDPDLLRIIPNPWAEMPIDVRQLDDRQMFELGIAENIHRNGLNPIETARAMKVYRETFGASQAETATLFEYANQGTVSNFERLLTLPDETQQLVQDGKIPQRLARQLVGLKKLPAVKVNAIAAKVAAAPDSDRESVLADEVDNLVGGKQTRQLDDENVFPRTFTAEGKWPSCDGCEQRIALFGGNNTVDVCQNPTCWGNKRAAWGDLLLSKQSAALQIDIVAKGEDLRPIASEWRDWELDAVMKKLIRQHPPFLRLVFNPDVNSDYDERELLGQGLHLGVTDVKAYNEWMQKTKAGHAKETKAAEKAEASDDPKARVRHEKEILAMREEKGRAVRNHYDVIWVIRNAVEIIGKGVQISPAAVIYLAEIVEKHNHIYSGMWGMEEFADEIRKAHKAAAPLQKEITARKTLALYLFIDEGSFNIEDRQFVEKNLLAVAKGLGVTLPAGWNKPPIHQTDHNCWHCGRFASQDGKILQAEIESGWGSVWQGGTVLDVRCPDCANKDMKPAAKKPAKKK